MQLLEFSGEPAGTRTEGPRLKRATRTHGDHVRSSVTDYDIVVENTVRYSFMIVPE